jgi:predicted urease superfamily metal-dependent hydrolase
LVRKHILSVIFGKDIAAPSKTTEQKFSIARVAQVIGVHPATVSRLIDSGKLGYYQSELAES